MMSSHSVSPYTITGCYWHATCVMFAKVYNDIIIHINLIIWLVKSSGSLNITCSFLRICRICRDIYRRYKERDRIDGLSVCMEIKKYFIFGSQDFRQTAGLHVAEHLACGRVRLKGPMQTTEDGFVLPQRMEVVTPVGDDHFFQAPIGISWGYHIWTFLDTSVLWPFKMWQIKVAGGKCGVTPCWYVVCVAVLRTTRGQMVSKLVDQHFKHINSCSKKYLTWRDPHSDTLFWHILTQLHRF